MRMPAARTASSTACVPIRFVCRKPRASSIERSTCDSAAAWTTASTPPTTSRTSVGVVHVARARSVKRGSSSCCSRFARDPPIDSRSSTVTRRVRLREQRIHQMGTDEPGATGDEDVVGGHRRRRTPAASSLAAVLRRTAQHGRGLARRALPRERRDAGRARRAQHVAEVRRPPAARAGPPRSPTGSSGSTSTAASPATSGSEDVFEVSTGTFAANPSSTGNPNPSARDG